MILNQRSCLLNYHGVMNALVLWDNQVPKRVIQLLNRVGWCTLHRSLGCCVYQLARDAVSLARSVAHDPSKVKLLPYDNFNWAARAWETSAMHGTVQHDQVSAMLVVLHLNSSNSDMEGPSAQHLTSVERFAPYAGRRHCIPADEALERIVPNKHDQHAFRESASIHVAHILTEEIESFRSLQGAIPSFSDPHAIPPHQTECYYLPTFDQEQGSTRGNMVVLRHYFLDVLQLPKSIFENTMYFILGDRLTTARDRAAQDQRAVDRSDFRIDHLSSFAMTSGLMHVCLNFIINIGKNLWGESSNDPTSLRLLCSLLPNRGEINLRKIDFYAWLRFLDVVLRALVVTAAIAIQQADSLSSLAQTPGMTSAQLHALSLQIVDNYLIPSPDRLEEEGIKVIQGETYSGHAILVMHDLMTLREMRHAIKHGHPTRVFRMLKYWTPMFYAGRSYNYANECMELSHNLLHDWPPDSAKALLAGMLVNNSGRKDGFVEADLNCEHLNRRIQALTRGPNVTPRMLALAAPAVGHIRHLTEDIFREMGVEEQNQKHSHVQQHKDVQALVHHFLQHKVFDFRSDVATERTVTDLYPTGLQCLAGQKGGHAKHLIRHRLRLRTRHGTSTDTFPGAEPDALDVEAATTELRNGSDYQPVEFTTQGSTLLDLESEDGFVQGLQANSANNFGGDDMEDVI